MWGNIKRLAGASAGAMFATLLAIGYNSYEIEEFLGMNLREYFLGKFIRYSKAICHLYLANAIHTNKEGTVRQVAVIILLTLNANKGIQGNDTSLHPCNDTMPIPYI